MDRFLSIKRKPAQTRSRKINRLIKTVLFFFWKRFFGQVKVNKGQRNVSFV